MLHPDEGTIHAWLDDQLPPEERAQLEQHFDQCERCAVLVVEARGLAAGAARIVGALDDVRRGVVPPKRAIGATRPGSMWGALRLTPVRAAIAATLLLATATVFTVRQTDRTRAVASDAMATPASAMPPVAAHAPVAAGVAPATTPPRQRAGLELRGKRTADALADSTAIDARREMAANAGLPLRADSIAMRESKAAAAPQPVSPTRRAFASALSEIVATGMVQTTDPRAFGCYRLDVDSLPERYTSLRQFDLSAPNGVNVVRALGASGRPDSVIAGAVWRPLDRDSVAVLTPGGSPPATLVFALTDEGRKATGRLTANGQTMAVQVLRMRCP